MRPLDKTRAGEDLQILSKAGLGSKIVGREFSQLASSAETADFQEAPSPIFVKHLFFDSHALPGGTASP
jgi:hypothetical protein